jgi:hypothetical protein
MNFATQIALGRQDFIDNARSEPEFAAFRGIEVAAAPIRAAFEITPDGAILLGDAAFARPALLAFHLRHALELAWLRRHPAQAAPARAALAAARTAALFAASEDFRAEDRAALPCWVRQMQAEVAPDPAVLARAAQELGVEATADDLALIRNIWSCLGTAEALMETGGDIRLARDPLSSLNGYGASHRPRPWAVTFASSTASSSSERGYAAADAARLRATAAMLSAGARQPVRNALQAVRTGLAETYSLPAGSEVVLAASGTDTELLALAITHLARPDLPIRNILVAPEETGSGVPMAARGLHFAVDTALGHDVSRAAPIEGFRADTVLATIPLRAPDGAARPAATVEAEIVAELAAGISAGQRVILHVLDLSKTGLLAPGLDCLWRLRAVHGDVFDIVVDACQARLSPASVKTYLALDAVVLITGSKFFTGPPFAGAALIPQAIAARFAHRVLPAGLDAYFGRDDFGAPCPAAASLPPVGNYGLALRWHAALAEMAALFAVPPPDRARILNGFAAVVRSEVAKNPAILWLPAPPIQRAAQDEAWERCPTIFSFALATPTEPDRALTPDEARAVYRWLNADLSQVLAGLDAPAKKIAALICHIGQPVNLPRPDGRWAGVLRVSAGARLISGEPSHLAYSAETRLAREFADLRLVFAKIGLILRNFPRLRESDPQPRFR